jgi:lipopolysaccharide transport system permease protein
LVGNQQLISKIYFPRLFLPLGAVGAFILDLFLALGLMVGLLIRYHWPLTISVVWLPVFILGRVAAAGGMGLIFAALNVSFRDIKYVVPFFVQMLFFATSIIYPVQYVPAEYQVVVGLNPRAGFVLGFRYALHAG